MVSNDPLISCLRCSSSLLAVKKKNKKLRTRIIKIKQINTTQAKTIVVQGGGGVEFFCWGFSTMVISMIWFSFLLLKNEPEGIRHTSSINIIPQKSNFSTVTCVVVVCVANCCIHSRSLYKVNIAALGSSLYTVFKNILCFIKFIIYELTTARFTASSGVMTVTV